MTTENQRESIESQIVENALEDEEISEEQLESVAGGCHNQNKAKQHKHHHKTVGQKHTNKHA